MLSPRLSSSGTGTRGGVCLLKGGGRVFCPECPGGGGKEGGIDKTPMNARIPDNIFLILSLYDSLL